MSIALKLDESYITERRTPRSTRSVYRRAAETRFFWGSAREVVRVFRREGVPKWRWANFGSGIWSADLSVDMPPLSLCFRPEAAAKTSCGGVPGRTGLIGGGVPGWAISDGSGSVG